jgi:hypothetical protein
MFASSVKKIQQREKEKNSLNLSRTKEKAAALIQKY